jgi:hypothetical protein
VAFSYDRLNAAVRDKFGLDVLYTPDGGSPRTVKAIVEQDYYSETGGVGIQTGALVFQVVDADVPELAVGDGFELLSVAYVAVEVKPDFNGMTDVVLNRA